VHMFLRRSSVAALVTTAAALGTATAASAQAIPFTNWTLSGSFTLHKLNKSIPFPSTSTFNGSVDLATGALSGNFSIPTFTASVRVLGVPANATIQFVQSQPLTGTLTGIGSPTVTASASASATIKILRVSSPILSINFVPPGCQTRSPVLLPLHYTGPLSLTSGFTFSSTLMIPPMINCGLATPLLTGLLSGPGNSFAVTVLPPT